MSDTVQITAAVLAFLGTVFTGIMTYLMARLNKKADTAAIKTEEVKESLVTTQAKADVKLDVIHTLVNSQMGLALEAVARLRREKADRSDDPTDRAEATAAQDQLDAHYRQQQMVDDAGDDAGGAV
jgi:hypothetical protein